MAIPDNGILLSIKKYLPIKASDTSFDDELIIHINSVLPILVQLGVSDNTEFVVRNDQEEWSSFIPNDNTLLSLARYYTYLCVKLIFDPPASSTHLKMIEEQRDHYQYRIIEQIELMKS